MTELPLRLTRALLVVFRQTGSLPVCCVPGTAVSRGTLSGTQSCVVVEPTVGMRNVKAKAQPSHFMEEEKGLGT